MRLIIDQPFFLFFASLVIQWLGAYLGDFARKRRRRPREDEWSDLSVVQTATLTLLALIIGFSFSMAVGRYDQRKNLEEAEANAIGTEYLRADLLPPQDAARVRDLLSKYVDQRIAYYLSGNEQQLHQTDAESQRLQAELWSAVLPEAASQPNPVVALIVSGMNDVLNSQGYTQAAWWNRIPTEAWALMLLIAVASNVLLGYGEHQTRTLLLWIMPVVASIAFLLVADIDSPRFGLIRVMPQNLMAFADSIKPH